MAYDLADKLLASVEILGDGECWPWTGATRKGYGRIGNLVSHRVAYEVWRGPIGAGTPRQNPINHRCEYKLCHNPWHLEVSAPKANARYSAYRSANSLKTECKNGHLYTDSNTGRRPDGRRYCKRCVANRVAGRGVGV